MLFELEGNLMEDIFDLDKYLNNGVDIYVYIKFFCLNVFFIIMLDESILVYKLEFLDVVYKVVKVCVDLGVLINYSK